MTETLREGTYYAPTYFKDGRPPDPDGGCTILVKHLRQIRMKNGRLRLYSKSEGLYFPTEEEMVAAIDEGGWEELPKEADEGQFATVLPEEFRA